MLRPFELLREIIENSDVDDEVGEAAIELLYKADAEIGVGDEAWELGDAVIEACNKLEAVMLVTDDAAMMEDEDDDS